jgi:type IV pilus assembly protein PilV
MRVSSGCGGHGGFTLVEALVAVVVLAVGMLGTAGMLVHSLRSSRLALQRTQAVTLAADIGDRIRADRAAAGSFALAAGTTLGAPPKSCVAVDECNPAEVAAVDLHDWQRSVLRALPGAQTAIAVAPAPAPSAALCTITITWTETGEGTAAELVLTVQA